MPATLSKPEDSKAERQRTLNLLKCSTFLSTLQHTIMIQTEPMLVKQLLNDDAALGAQALANTQGLVGLLGLFLNQSGGKMSDAIGRKPFLLLGPLGNIFLGALVTQKANSRLVVLTCRILRMVITTFSNTVIVGAAMADTVAGDDLARESSKIGSVVGAAMVVAPIIENFLLTRFRNYRAPYFALSALAVFHACVNISLMPETLRPEKRIRVQDITLNAFNPFGFLKIFYEGSKPLQKLVTITSFQMILEGKNISDMGMTWMREHIKWDVGQMRNYIVAYGILCIGTGSYLTPYLIKTSTARGFTVLADMLAAVAYFLRGSSETGAMWLVTVPLILPGVNANAALRLKALATGRAVSEGFGKGEFSAWINNLRALAGAASPVLLGNWYAMTRRKGLPAGSVYYMAAILGALLPELLLYFTSDNDLEPAPQRKSSIASLPEDDTK